jgi:hypothetical protein
MKKSFSTWCRQTIVLSLVMIFMPVLLSLSPASQEYYQLKVYRFSTKSQEDRLDRFLKDSYLPALHRAGINTIGVFKPVRGEDDYGSKIYVLIPFSSMTQFLNLPGLLEKDRQYQNTGKDYIVAAFDAPPYDRIESTLMRAFKDMPALKVPDHSTPPGERIYEMRSYESSTEKLYEKKVHMFNEGGEIKLFEKLNFNAVFYGEVLSGSTMPNLIYMTTFPTRAVRDEFWGIFRVDPEWQIMRDLEQYRNTVSKNNTFFLYPTDYSDI